MTFLDLLKTLRDLSGLFKTPLFKFRLRLKNLPQFYQHSCILFYTHYVFKTGVQLSKLFHTCLGLWDSTKLIRDTVRLQHFWSVFSLGGVLSQFLPCVFALYWGGHTPIILLEGNVLSSLSRFLWTLELANTDWTIYHWRPVLVKRFDLMARVIYTFGL